MNPQGNVAGLDVLRNPPNMGGIFWVGTDGNVYYKGPGGNAAAVKNMGASQGTGTVANLTLNGASQVDDPNPGGANNPRPAGPANSNGVAAAPAPKPDRSNSIALQNAGLAALGGQTDTGLASINSALARLIGQYDTESGANEKTYGTQSVTNQQNLQRNKQISMVNAAQGRQGLFGTLSSLGALSGTGIDLANRAVQKGANEDLTGAADNFAENQQGLDTSIGQFRQEDKFRRENANTSAENARTNVQGDAAKQRQQFYTQLANDYAAMGNEGESKKYAALASGEFGNIAKSNVPNAQLNYSGAAFTPASLSSYIAGADNTSVSVTPASPGGLPGLVASPSKKKRLQPVPA